jgi:hypothetical protein
VEGFSFPLIRKRHVWDSLSRSLQATSGGGAGWAARDIASLLAEGEGGSRGGWEAREVRRRRAGGGGRRTARGGGVGRSQRPWMRRTMEVGREPSCLVGGNFFQGTSVWTVRTVRVRTATWRNTKGPQPATPRTTDGFIGATDDQTYSL